MKTPSETFPEGQCVFVDVSAETQAHMPLEQGYTGIDKEVSKTVPMEAVNVKKGPPHFVKIGIASLVVCCLFYVLLFIYLGASSNQTGYSQNLEITVVNLDDGLIGKAFVAFARSLQAGNGLPSFNVLSSATFDDARNRVANAVSWGAVVVQPNAWNNLLTAFRTVNNTYMTSSAIQFIYDESRFPTVVASRVSGPVRALLTSFCQNISASIVQDLGSDPASSARLASAASSAPRLLSQPVWFTEDNLHPATIQVAVFGLTVGMILLVVFTWSGWMAAYGITEPATPPVTLAAARALFLTRFAVVAWITFCISLSFTLIWQALGADFPSSAAWVSFWLVHWLNMVNYGMTYAAATNILTFQKAPAAIIFIIIFNGSGAFNELSLASPFYQWGWAMPMAHAVMASRTLIYGGRDQVHTSSLLHNPLTSLTPTSPIS